MSTAKPAFVIFAVGDECKLKETDPLATGPEGFGACIMTVVSVDHKVDQRSAVLVRFIDPKSGDDMASVVRASRLVKMPRADWRIVFAEDTADGLGTVQLGSVSYPYLSAARAHMSAYSNKARPVGFAIFPSVVQL